MKYAEIYSRDDLFDMFANDAISERLVVQPTAEIASDLVKLAPDMEDSQEVAVIIQRVAASQQLHANM